MRRGIPFTLVMFLLMPLAWAGVPREQPPIGDTALANFLDDLAAHLNTLECLTVDPNGSVLGTKGELKCAEFSGVFHACMNTSDGPNKGTSWECQTFGVHPTTGIFCGGTLSTSMNCENFRGRIPVACTPSRLDITVTTAPTGAAILVDANECDSNGSNCATLFSTQANRPTIAISGTTGSTTTFNDTSIALGNMIGFDIDQVGSTVAGSHLTVTLVCE